MVINWKVIPGSLVEIKAGSKDVAWGRDGQNRVYAMVNGQFEYVADERKFISISVKGSEVWAVDSKGNVLYREGVTASDPKVQPGVQLKKSRWRMMLLFKLM